MKNLGKIIAILLILNSQIFATVKATVDARVVTKGDVVTLTLSLNGDDISRPTVRNLCQSEIVSTGSSTSIRNINGSFTKTYELSYSFMPTKNCTIEPIDVTIDNKAEKTEPITIEVKEVVSSKDEDFIISMKSSKKELFVGEPFELTLLLKQRNGIRFVDSKFTPPELSKFWIKSETEPKRYQEGDYVVTEISYTIAPQRASKQIIESAIIKIAKRVNNSYMYGMMGQGVKWKSYLSNELELNIKPLPNGVKLVGDFTIDAEVKKSEIDANEPLNLVVTIRGDGNLEDVTNLKPFIKDVNIFDEKIIINGKKLTQKMVIISDVDFTIPPFRVEYFNPKTKKVETISTKAIDIKVKNQKTKESLEIIRDESAPKQEVVTEYKESSKVTLLAIFLTGLLLGIAVMILLPKLSKINRKKEINLKEPKQLLIKLLPHKADKEVANLIELLEKKIYSNEVVEIDKKVVKEMLRKYLL